MFVQSLTNMRFRLCALAFCLCRGTGTCETEPAEHTPQAGANQNSKCRPKKAQGMQRPEQLEQGPGVYCSIHTRSSEGEDC